MRLRFKSRNNKSIVFAHAVYQRVDGRMTVCRIGYLSRVIIAHIKEYNQLIKLGQTFQMVILVRRCAIRATVWRPADSAGNNDP